MEIKEEWRTIENYPDYQVSSLGRVKSLKNGKERILKNVIMNVGYYNVDLCENGKIKAHRVHRLVAQAFIPNPQNLPQVNHKDENKTNNCVSNLEWCTQKYNNNYGTKIERQIKTFKKNGKMIGRIPVNKGVSPSKETRNKMSKAMKGKKQAKEFIEKRAKAHQKSILQFNIEGTKILGKWESIKQASIKLNIDSSGITKCLKKKIKTCGGYRWMYLQDYVNRMEKLYNLALKKAS